MVGGRSDGGDQKRGGEDEAGEATGGMRKQLLVHVGLQSGYIGWMSYELPKSRNAFVVDWNLLQHQLATADWFADKLCLLPETIAIECLDKDENERDRYARKLTEWILRSTATIYSARNFLELFKLQFQREMRVRRNDLIDDLSTRALRRRKQNGQLDFTKGIMEVRNASRFEGMEEMRLIWVKSCETFAKACAPSWQSDFALRSRLENDEKLSIYLNEYEGYANWASNVFKSLFRAGWREQMKEAPNYFALGRWGRLCFYYSICRLRGGARKFENNFDDAQYLLLASYSGFLATNDGGLERAARVCFPDMRIWTPVIGN